MSVRRRNAPARRTATRRVTPAGPREQTVSGIVRFSLAVARIGLAGWVGAAALFVVVSVREVRLPELESLHRAALALARFPAFYAFGFSLCGLSCLALLMANARCRSGMLRASLVLAVSGLLVMLADYLTIYRPLVAMLQAPEVGRPAAFVTYHRWSMYVNALAWTLNLAGAVLVCATEPCVRPNGAGNAPVERASPPGHH